MEINKQEFINWLKAKYQTVKSTSDTDSPLAEFIKEKLGPEKLNVRVDAVYKDGVRYRTPDWMLNFWILTISAPDAIPTEDIECLF